MTRKKLTGVNAEIVNLICDTHRGRVPQKFSEVPRHEREDAIRKAIFEEVLGLPIDTPWDSKQYRNAMRKKKYDVYEIIEEMVDNIVIDGDAVRDAFYSQFAEVKNLALGDTNEFYAEGCNTLTLSEFSGNHFNIKRNRIDVGDSFTVEMKDYGISVYEYFDRFLAGRCDLAKLVALAQEAINKGISEAIYTAFAEALTKIPAEFTYTGLYNEGLICNTLGHVEAHNGKRPILLSTRMGIAKLQDKVAVSGLSEAMKDQKNKIGYVEYWNGYQCITLPQIHKKGTFDFVFDNDTILAITGGEKIVKVCFEGNSQVREITENGDNADKSIQTTITLKFGTAIVFNGVIGTIEITG